MGLFRRINSIITNIVNRYHFKKNGIKIGKMSRLNGVVTIKCDMPQSISIGDYFKVNSGEKYNQIGGDTRCILSTVQHGMIQIGDNVGISNSCIIAREKVLIQNDVRIGGSCKIYDNDFHSLLYSERMKKTDKDIKCRQITICEGAFIGACSIILKGVTIGRHSVVGAGSVVTKSIPDNEIWAGNPARFIRKIEED